MLSDENGRKNLISISISIFFGGNRIGFGKYGYGNGIGLRGSTETILEYTLTKSQNNIHV